MSLNSSSLSKSPPQTLPKGLSVEKSQAQIESIDQDVDFATPPRRLPPRHLLAESYIYLFIIASLFIALITLIIGLAVTQAGGLGSGWPLGLYSTLLISYLLIKMGLAFKYRPFTAKYRSNSIQADAPGKPLEKPLAVLVRDGVVSWQTPSITAVIPTYNESPEALVETIRSLMHGSVVPDEVYVVDDGSRDPKGFQAASALTRQYPNLIVHRLEQNVGKRRAQGWAFRRMRGDLILTVDSDTQYDHGAVAAMIAAFDNSEVMAVGGQIRARNRDANLLTRLLDMRYHNAYQVERAAQSVSGAMLCCSGPIAMYRREVIMDNLDDYENQVYLGKVVTTGDDRRLTQYSLQRGLVRYQALATCETEIPSSVRVFIKQQVRWTKSFFRESGESIRFALREGKWTMLGWTILEIVLWAVFTASVLLALAGVRGSHTLEGFALAAIYIALAAWARNVFYLFRSPLIFLLAPVYGIFHLVVLFPVRLYALATMKDTRWGTR